MLRFGGGLKRRTPVLMLTRRIYLQFTRCIYKKVRGCYIQLSEGRRGLQGSPGGKHAFFRSSTHTITGSHSDTATWESHRGKSRKLCRQGDRVKYDAQRKILLTRLAPAHFSSSPANGSGFCIVLQQGGGVATAWGHGE